MANRGRIPSEKTLVDRQIGRNIINPVLPAGEDYIVPNHSGDHTAGETDTPTADRKIANKGYVDSSIFWEKDGDEITQKDTLDKLHIKSTDNSEIIPEPIRIVLFESDSENDAYFTLRAHDSQAGEERRMYIEWKGLSDERLWLMGKSWTADFILYDAANGSHRLQFFDGSATIINATGSSAVSVNSAADGNSGTGGFKVYSGGASPKEVFSVDSLGNVEADEGFRIGYGGGTNAYLKALTAANDSILFFYNKNDVVRWEIRDDNGVFKLNQGLGTNNRLTVLPTGEIGMGTSTPTQNLSVAEKGSMTTLGGFAIKITNKTGANSVAGQLVMASVGTTDAFETAVANDTNVIGIVADAGVADGSEAWIVVAGIANVLVDAGGSTRGDRILSSTTAGSGIVDNSPSTALHFQEIGHCIESRVGAGLARCVLHFN